MTAAQRMAFLILLLFPSTAPAVLVSFTGSLEFDVGTVAPFSIPGSGMVDVSPADGSFTLPADAFVVATTRIPPQTTSEIYASIGFFMANAAGTFGGPGAAGGSVPLIGSIVGRPQPLLGFPDITIGASPLGAGGTLSATASNGSTSATVFLQGALWQTGMFTQVGTSASGPFVTVVNTGVDNRTPLGAGSLSMVVPAQTVTNLNGGFLESGPFAVKMTINIPEPATLTMQIAGAALLVGLGRRRQVRKRAATVDRLRR